LFQEYLFIFKHLFISFLLCLFLFCVSVFFVFQQFYAEKLSSYECGFNPYEDARNKFEVRFYLIGLLFIIFDLEIVYLFPWALQIFHINLYGIFAVFFFIFILTLGFVYE
jgi:NADH:ubiquinone oxidoreductase subunit 3 (subunit A)